MKVSFTSISKHILFDYGFMHRLSEIKSDLKQFVDWFEAPEHQEEETIFCIEDVSTPTLTWYREVVQRITELKTATINRQVKTL
ncbi:hypothetical protein [Desulfosporosinus fructosivorans]|uniref:hypothetical protein n=1 Tax=Desulfosporosinus fructosivorans TaxID=2018669 RepID=UPI001A7EF2AF|nr:hypothetical protein [Desulfosporosinus fructosivorans]